MQQYPDFRVKPASWLARLAAWKLGVPAVAITIGRTIHLHRAEPAELLSNQAWLRHELCHVEQFRRFGMPRFIFLYLWESFRRGYTQNRFEVEARAAETNPAYDPRLSAS